MAYPVEFNVERKESYSRLTTFFRCIMVIPHAIVLGLWGIAAGVCVFISWWVILFTGKFPEGLFNFVRTFMRYQVRVLVYYNLMRDEYPPFSGDPTA
jgi:hypothetical protein